MGAQQLEPLIDCLIFARQHPTFTRADVFVGEETKTSNVTNGAQFDQRMNRIDRMIFRQWAMAGIFDNLEIMLTRDGHDRLHITGEASIVHHCDRLCALRNLCFNLLR